MRNWSDPMRNPHSLCEASDHFVDTGLEDRIHRLAGELLTDLLLTLGTLLDVERCPFLEPSDMTRCRASGQPAEGCARGDAADHLSPEVQRQRQELHEM